MRSIVGFPAWAGIDRNRGALVGRGSWLPRVGGDRP